MIGLLITTVCITGPPHPFSPDHCCRIHLEVKSGSLHCDFTPINLCSIAAIWTKRDPDQLIWGVPKCRPPRDVSYKSSQSTYSTEENNGWLPLGKQWTLQVMRKWFFYYSFHCAQPWAKNNEQKSTKKKKKLENFEKKKSNAWIP